MLSVWAHLKILLFAAVVAQVSAVSSASLTFKMAGTGPAVNTVRRRLRVKTKDEDWGKRVPFVISRREGVARELLRQAKLQIDRFYVSQLTLKGLRDQAHTAELHATFMDLSQMRHDATDHQVEDRIAPASSYPCEVYMSCDEFCSPAASFKFLYESMASI